MTEATLRAIPYFGGKSPVRSGGACHWISDMLPYADAYAEPFAGMLGVLLSRTPSNAEFVNDLNERLVNWWRAVRDEPGAFSALVRRTPLARKEFEWAKEHLDDMDLSPLRRALAFHVVVAQSINHSDHRSATWGYQVSDKRLIRIADGMIDRLAERLRFVQLECRDACEVLERLAHREGVVTYCDPPYYSSTTKYGVSEIDVDRMSAAAREFKSPLAISGYGEEWDHIGFVRNERRSCAGNFSGVNTESPTHRTEVLWTNFEPHPRLF